MSGSSGGAVLGLAAGHTDRAELEHVLARVVDRVGPVELACTHVVDGRWAGSVRLSGTAPDPTPGLDGLAAGLGVALTGPGGTAAGDPAWWAAAERAAAELAARRGGRAVVFGGQERLVGEVAADDVPTLSAVEAVVGIAGTATAGVTLVTRDHVRPVLVDGWLVLEVRPFGPDGAVAPFEVPNPTPCCAAHG